MKIGKRSNLILLAIIWSFFLAAQGYASQSVGSFTIGFFTFLIAWFLLLISMVMKNTISEVKKVNGILHWLIIIGIIGSMCSLSSFLGYRYGNIQTGTFLLKTDVMLVSIGSILIYKEKFTKTDMMCAVAMFIGILFVLDINTSHLTFVVPDLFFVLSAFFLSVNTFLIAHVVRQNKQQINSFTVAFYNSLVGIVIFTILMFLFGTGQEFALVFKRWDILIALGLCGVGQYIVYISYYRALKEFPVWFVKVILLMIPILTMVITFFLYGMIPSLISVLGGGIVLISGGGMLFRQRTSENSK